MKGADIVGSIPDENTLHIHHLILGVFDGYAALWALSAFLALCCMLWGAYKIRQGQMVQRGSRSAKTKKRF
jgi:hypothetical protein